MNQTTFNKKRRPIYMRKRVVLPLLTILVILIGGHIAVSATHGNSIQVDVIPLKSHVDGLSSDHIRVMTINMAHGRSDGRSQIIQPNTIIEKNVDNIGKLVAREGAQVVALQEADAPSWWSGQFSHVNTVGTVGGMKSAIQGLNVDGLGLHYGTAVVTQLEVSDAHQVTFEKSFPTFSKGFVVVTSTWPGKPEYTFDVVSLHLDFASATVRAKQMSILSNFVKNATRPVIIMGDFNTDMSSELLPTFLKETRLQTWDADDTTIITFPTLGTRIDWIFVSQEFRIVEQRVLDDVLSDHRIIVADIELK